MAEVNPVTLGGASLDSSVFDQDLRETIEKMRSVLKGLTPAIELLYSPAEMHRRVQLYIDDPKGEDDFLKRGIFKSFRNAACAGVGGGALGSIVPGLGTLIGAGAGFAAGMIGTATYDNVVNRNAHFDAWRKRYADRNINKDLLEIFKKSEVLSEFSCAISQEILTDPVVDINARPGKGKMVFERRFAEEWVIKNGTLPSTGGNANKDKNPGDKDYDPTSVSKRMTVNDLRTDYETLGQLQATYRCILLACKQNRLFLTQAQQEAFEAFHRDIVTKIRASFQQVQKELQQAVDSGNLTSEASALYLLGVAKALEVETPSRFQLRPTSLLDNKPSNTPASAIDLLFGIIAPGDRKEGDGENAVV